LIQTLPFSDHLRRIGIWDREITKNFSKPGQSASYKRNFPVIKLSCSIMDTFGSLKAELSRNGEVVDDFDLIIAATDITMGYSVVSNNEK